MGRGLSRGVDGFGSADGADGSVLDALYVGLAHGVLLEEGELADRRGVHEVGGDQLESDALASAQV